MKAGRLKPVGAWIHSKREQKTMIEAGTPQNLHARIHALLREEVSNNPVSYNKETPYQSYERIGFEGLRWSVEKRIREYGLEEFFGENAAILDIGSNFGFFVCEFALHCRLSHGIEPNPELNKIGEITAAHLGISDRVKFHNCLFDDFKSAELYDTVFSLAAFFAADGRERADAGEYFAKINNLLKPGGRVFYESTSYTKKAGSGAYSHFTAAETATNAMTKIMSLEREWETPSGSEGYFRRFAIATAATS